MTEATTIDSAQERMEQDISSFAPPTNIEDMQRNEEIRFYEIGSEEGNIIERAKADGTYMKAPNGNPTNLNEKQWLQVRTKAFKEWFGDWENNPTDASKIVDINGEPKILYHFSPEKDINIFNIVRRFKPEDKQFSENIISQLRDKRGEKGTKLIGTNIAGIWFTEDKEYSAYGENQYACFLDVKNPIVGDNIFIRKSSSLTYDREKGVDGYIANSKTYFCGEVSVSLPEQIKSATCNNGDFSSSNDDIRYRFIGEKGAANLDAAEEGTARLDNLTVAGDMEADGKDAQTVKPATGWERGSDRLWRYEEPDLILRDVLLQKDTNGQIVVPLQEIIRDENLFNAYPFLKGTVVAEDYGTGEGFYNEATNTIGLNTKKFIPVKSNSNEGLISELQSKLEELESYPEVRAFNRMFESGQANDVTKIDSFLEEHPNAKKYSELEDKLWDLCHDKKIIGYRVTDRATIVHEVQHVIQSLEGFARGGSAEEFKDTRTDVVRDLNFSTDGRLLKGNAISDSRSIRLALDKKVPYTDINLAEGYHKQLQQIARKYGYADIENLIDNFDGMPTAREQYHKLAGEVEARNAESRMDLTSEERGSTLSVTTEDVAREHQTILAYTKERMELAGYASSLAEKQHIPASIITSPDDIPSEEIRRLIAGRADIRGWYDVPSDRVCLYLPNATGKADIGRTLLHEGVAHYGLRKTVGNENMNRFLDDVYAGADGQIRRDIQTIASSRSLNVREATEEYLANLAEHDATPGFRDKIRQFLTDILRAMGFNIQIKNSDLESILSKSKANLQCIPPKGNDTSLFFKGGRREITINSGKAVIRTNGNEYDAAAILKSLKKANVDIKGISAGQWEKMLKGQGTVLDPERPGTLFSIQKQSCGYGIRVVSVDLQSAKGVQNEI